MDLCDRCMEQVPDILRKVCFKFREVWSYGSKVTSIFYFVFRLKFQILRSFYCSYEYCSLRALFTSSTVATSTIHIEYCSYECRVLFLRVLQLVEIFEYCSYEHCSCEHCSYDQFFEYCSLRPLFIPTTVSQRVFCVFGRFSWGFWSGFNTSLPLCLCTDLHSSHSYWSEILIESNLIEKEYVLLFTPPLVAFSVQQLDDKVGQLVEF